MFQYILLDLRIGCSILELRHIHIFQRELNPNLFRVDLTLGKQDNRLTVYCLAVAVDFFRSIVYVKYMMSGAKAPDLDACGLFRAVHSHNPAR